MNNQDEREAERNIARKYMGTFPWFMVIWGLGAPALWFALWPLVITNTLPLWAAGLISTVIMSYAYLPTHEAQHGNIGRPGSRWHWLNELVGHASVLPLFFPYRLHRIIHLKHHAHTNIEGKDPDVHMKADNLRGAIYKAWLSRQPGNTGPLQGDMLKDAPDAEKLMREAFLLSRFGWLLMAVLAWSGLALEVLCVWWLPKILAGIYVPVILSWAPHHPMEESGRYRSTKGWKSPIGTILTAGMEYHLVHHLFPAIPLNRTPAAYRELKPLLQKKGMSLNGL